MAPVSAAKLRIDVDRVIGAISPLLFGGFAEHMGRCVYEGIYDPESKLTDESGFRTDVMAALRQMGVTILRYPGGNFVCTYDWKDGVGPRNRRPARRDLAWRQIDTNAFGLDEFIDYCRQLSCEPLLSLNLSTGDLRSVSELVEYCNAPGGTFYADQRIRNGHQIPHDVRFWCLGNEVDGPWQIGQTDAITYGRLAREAAKIIKRHDPRNKTILCGSSTPTLPTYPAWDQTVLDLCWDQTDYIAMHHYAANDENDSASFLAYGVALEQHIDTIARTIRQIKGKHQSAHDVKIAWDEWNVWYKNRITDGQWQFAPHLCEETYNLEDALVVSQWLNLFLRRCDVLEIACLAQVVNTIAPLKTTSDALLKETIFYPIEFFASRARGVSLELEIDSPAYSTRRFGDAPQLDASASFDADQSRLAIFLVNRSLTNLLPIEIQCDGFTIKQFDDNHQIAGLDPKAANTWENPNKIQPKPVAPVPVNDGRARLVLPALSMTVLSASSAKK